MLPRTYKEASTRVFIAVLFIERKKNGRNLNIYGKWLLKG